MFKSIESVVVNENSVFNQAQAPKITNPVDQVKALTDRESYGFVNTREVLNAFSLAGWSPVSEQYGKVNKTDRQGFQKHLIRLENPQFQSIDGLTTANNSRPQLVLLNSHDQSTSLQIMWGLIRIACLNGIIAGTALNGVRLVHSKSITERLPLAIDYMVNNFDNFANQIKALQGKTMSQAATTEFVERVYRARLANVDNVTKIDLSLPHALRVQDNGLDAYTAFNRVQETLMRGGIKYQYIKHTKDDDGKIIDSRLIDTVTRRIASVTSQVKLNQLAYDTALEVAA